ncbi:MAG TPA: MFS transporter [Candidatus Bathyarchaeia archaeon]|nr:MFS transporter [Candidatus Bathyarchaeia archaeon]
MPNASPFSSLGISLRQFLLVFVLLFNSFIWFFMNIFILSTWLGTWSKNANVNNLLLWTVYLAAIVGSSLLGAVSFARRNRLALVYGWLSLGVITSLLLSTITMNINPDWLLIIIFLSGVAFGLGMPSALAYFAENTVFENRGLVGGIVFIFTNLSVAVASLFLGNNLVVDCYIAGIWRALCLVIFFLIKPHDKVENPGRGPSFRSVLSQRTFLLFLIPWFMFCLIDRFAYQIFFAKLLEVDKLSLSVEPIVGTIFALIGGLFADWIGRKKVIVFGFIAMGLAYAALGVAPKAPFSWYFYIAIDGIAWGIFLVLFVLVVWGDLSSSKGGCEKYYAVGSIPFFIAYLMQYFVQPYISSIQIGSFEASFSFASLFLFIAVLPLIYAPETLPEKKIQERQIRKYAEEARKLAKREDKKEEA